MKGATGHWAAAAIACFVALTPVSGAAGAGPELRFDRASPEPLRDQVAFDLGVLDAPGEPARAPLAPFTINHMFPATLLAGGEDVTVEAGLSPLPAFPGYERLQDAPAPGAPGLYVHASDAPDRAGAELRLLAHAMPASGRVVFASRSVSAVAAEGVSWQRRTTPDGLVSFSFTIAPGAALVFDVANNDLPVFVRDSAQPTWVGPDAVPAAGPDFTLELRDRHSYSSADFDGDGDRDLFIAGGGYGGAIERYARWARDELLLARGGSFRRGPAPPKAICRGRASAAPDADRDGLADVFVDCEGASPRLHLNRGGGRWDTRELEVEGTTFRWLGADRDRAVELLAFGPTAMTAYEGGVEREYSVALRGAPSGPPAVGDLLGLGRPVVYVPSTDGSTLVAGRRALDPVELGLPDASTAAAIVDVDNDGARDLHLAPQGLYLQDGGGRFEATGRLGVEAAYVALTWADLEGDGRRDLLALSGKGPFAPAKRIRRFRNRTQAGNWLAVDSAELMLGDRIEVRAGGERQVGWVGESEGSRWSDTHRRVYFGLGEARRASVVVRPARGGKLTFEARANRVIDPARRLKR